MKRYFKKCCAALSVLLLCALCVAIGFALGQGPRQENSQRRLLISVDIDPEDKGKGECFTLDELSGGIADNLVYSQGISNVIIQLDDSSVELDEAIKQGKVSVNEILFLAQEDAKNHICAIDFWSAAGLNNYIFRYPEFDMRVIDDVFEAPSGPQRRIQYLKFSRPNEDRDDPYVSFFNADGSGWTTREDWGLEFRKDEVSSSGIHLRCKQVGGQQMGELSLTMCYINNEDETKQWQVSDFVEIPIARNAWTDIRLDWTEAVGQLPPGNYTFLVNVDDQLNMRDETLVHLYQNPLMRNFWGNQWYEVSFTVD